MHRNGSALIRKADILLIIAGLILVLFLYLILNLSSKKGGRIRITVDGEEYGTYSLTSSEEIAIDKEGFHNTLVIRDKKAWMKEADCPDQICVHHTPVFREGETIICLPHKLVVTVLSSDREREFDN